MGLAEDGVVDFLAYAVQNGNIIVGVLGAAVALDGLIALVAQLVQLLEEVGIHHVVSIEYHHVVELTIGHSLRESVAVRGRLTIDLIDCILHSLGLRALLKDRLQQGDGQLGQFFVGLGAHVVGYDTDAEVGVGIILSEEGVHRVDNDAVFVVGRVEDKKSVVVRLQIFLDAFHILCQGRRLLLPQHGDEGKEQNVGARCRQQQPEQYLNNMYNLPNHNFLLTYFFNFCPTGVLASTELSRMTGMRKKVLSHLSSTK